MKKSAIAVFAGLVSAAAFAGMDNIVVSFSTVGPDTYADGTTVRDGEVYALVWTPSDAEFAGIGADGEAVAPSVVVKKAAKAKNGRCPYIAFQILEEDAAKYNGGTWGVYLLDTRKYASDPVTGIIDTSKEPTVGDASIVNGYGVVKTFQGSSTANASSSTAINAATVSVVPDLGADLKVTDISVDAENVTLTVTGSMSCLRYGVKSGGDPASLTESEPDRYGKDGEMTIVIPKKSGAQFFKVNRK